MSDEKTDIEFIAECERSIANDGQIGTYKGVPVIMTGGTYDLMKEAVERLKRANELRGLLAWLWERLEHPDVLAESAEKARIAEILK